jgi:uncharacterized ferredoxin-like protein
LQPYFLFKKFRKMLINERNSRKESLLSVARHLMTAARTAPKAKGVDIIEIAIATGEDIQRISDKLIEMSPPTGMRFFLRDAENILHAEAILLVGTRTEVQNLNCGYCGFASCAEKLQHPSCPCHLNAVDVGIALGSAAAAAADFRVDSRVMFSAGFAARELGLLDNCGSVYAMPISASAKSPFFDRRPKEEQKTLCPL